MSGKPSDHNDFVPFTARMMAAIRASESIKDDALFKDPFAYHLAGTEAFQRVEKQLTEKDKAYVAVRTYFFDNFLLSSKVDQVVILAAGLDTRSYRLPWPKGIKVYELDYPEVLNYKANLLKAEAPSCELHTIGVDLTQPWENKLLDEGFTPSQLSVWLIEGLLMYLSEDQVYCLLKSVSRLAVIGSSLGLDLVNVKSLDYEPYRGYFQSGWDMPEDLLSKYGWKAEVIQPGDKEANFGRYIWSLPPREIEGVERVFLIKAKQ